MAVLDLSTSFEWSSHDSLVYVTREIHPLEPQRHRHSMLAPMVCAPRVTRCSLGHVIWSVQLACSILSRSDSCQGDGRQRHFMMHGQCPIPVYSSQMWRISGYCWDVKLRKRKWSWIPFDIKIITHQLDKYTHNGYFFLLNVHIEAIILYYFFSLVRQPPLMEPISPDDISCSYFSLQFSDNRLSNINWL